MPDNILLRTKDAAALLGITRTHLRELHRQGKLLAMETPHGKLFTAADVERLRVQREARPRRWGQTIGERAAAEATT